MRTKWKSRWITPRAKLFDSKIDRKGIQAIAPISKGEIVAVLGGIIVPSEDSSDYRNTIGDYGIQINDRFYICPFSREDAQEVGAFNHSCDPNLGLTDSVTFVALRDIVPSEELTFDYAMTETQGDPFECNCQSTNCRKTIHISDWQLPDLQKRYGESFSPYIKNKKGFLGSG